MTAVLERQLLPQLLHMSLLVQWLRMDHERFTDTKGSFAHHVQRKRRPFPVKTLPFFSKHLDLTRGFPAGCIYSGRFQTVSFLWNTDGLAPSWNGCCHHWVCRLLMQWECSWHLGGDPCSPAGGFQKEVLLVRWEATTPPSLVLLGMLLGRHLAWLLNLEL